MCCAKAAGLETPAKTAKNRMLTARIGIPHFFGLKDITPGQGAQCPPRSDALVVFAHFGVPGEPLVDDARYKQALIKIGRGTPLTLTEEDEILFQELDKE